MLASLGLGAAELRGPLSPIANPSAFALATLLHALKWGGFSFMWQHAFEQYASLLERLGYLERDAKRPAISRWRMLRQDVVGIAGTVLPLSLALAYFDPVYRFPLPSSFSEGVFGALMLVPYVFIYVLAFDCYYYFGHRLCHAVPWLYRTVHKKHHLPSAALDVRSTSYMSFAEGFLLIGLPLVPMVLVPAFCLRGNFWAVASSFYTVLNLFFLGHLGARIKKDILPIFLMNPFLIVLGVTANATRPQDHTAHHDRVVSNYAVFFRLWDELCGTAVPPNAPPSWGVGKGAPKNKQSKSMTRSSPPPPITWRVMLYNVANFFSFFALLLLASGAGRVFVAALLVCSLPFGIGRRFVGVEAEVLRKLGLTRLVTRAGFWDGLRRDLRVSVCVEQEKCGAAAVAAVASPSSSSSPSSAPAAAPSAPPSPLPAAKKAAAALAAAPSLPAPPPSSALLPTPAGSDDVNDDTAALSDADAVAGSKQAKKQQQQQHHPIAGLFTPPQSPRPPLATARQRSASPTPPPPPPSVAAIAARGFKLQPLSSSSSAPPPPSSTTLYVYHPRGDMMRGAFFAFGARGSDPAHPLAQQKDVRLALPSGAARVLLRLPLLRQLVALLGGVDPSSVVPALKSGASVAMCLSGPVTRGKPRCQERRDSPPEFVRAALATGAALVPVVAAGEFELAGRLPLRDKMVMPSRPGCDIRIVFGEPITPTEGESAQQLRLRFASELAVLAARHGAPPVEPGDV
jgi:sterol desaturase/sphingolipid hydroxylase (fatty acid hydroxylase superfamily)